MADQMQEGILRKRDRLLNELAKVHKELGLPLPNGGVEPDGPVFDLAPSQAIRRLLADRRTPLEPACIVRALIKGNARVGTKHAEHNILRAIEVNVELGLLVER